MISRRNFLKMLVGSGAMAAFPFEIMAANDSQIENAWSEVCRDPVVFIVEDRTIYAPWAEYPKIYADVVDICTDFLTRESVLTTFDEHFDLQSHFYGALEVAASEEESLAGQLIEQFGMDDAVIAWIDQAPLEDLTGVIHDWLNSDLPDLYEMPLKSGPMGEAYAFFLGQEFKTLKALGVTVVDGEHPGSSYFAAEIRVPVEDANYAAAALELPIRFREA